MSRDGESDQNVLDELGLVNVLSQQSLEQRIGKNVDDLTNKKLREQELQRLERSNNLLEKLQQRKQYLERKLHNATRISVKARLKEQISELENGDMRDAKIDMRDVQRRLEALDENTVVEDNNTISFTGDGRKPGESETEYLVRIGKVTAFGSAAGFTIDGVDDDKYGETTPTLIKQELSGNDQAFAMANEQLVENIASEESSSKGQPSDQEYVDDGTATISEDDTGNEKDYIDSGNSSAELDLILANTGEAKDDGDEIYYQKRLRKWIKKRSVDRKYDKWPDLPEWRKPHPDIPTARLNDTFKVPGEIHSLLFNYQKTCVQWLYELYQQNCGGIVGDEMGLGKTIQVIAFLASLHHSGLLNGPILIVCPATVMKQWCNEFHIWWPPFRAVILHSMGSGMTQNRRTLNEEQLEEIIMNSNPDDISYSDLQNPSKLKTSIESGTAIDSLIEKIVNDGHVVITTYVGLRIHSDKLLKVKWAYAVLDEGHKIRNPDSDISLTCKKLKTPNRIILSGTPIQNNLNELWSLFDFIFPGKLGTLPVFQQQFVLPINMGGYANASNVQVQTGYKCAVALRDLISPYLLRRVKSDVAKDLPEKKEMVLFCKLTQYQKNKYMEFLNSSELDQIRGGKRHVLYGIDILRKICNHPDLLEKNEKQNTRDYGNPKRSGKMQVVKQLILLWKKQGHKTLLFTQSRQMLDILERFVSVNDPEFSDIRYLRMDGTTNISKRQNLVDQFNKGPFDLFLLTTRVGGLGINLTGANRIIIFDPDWNPSTDLQARERAWRIGQKREVSIYRLMVSGTIEEKIYHRQIFKQFLTNKILNDPRQKRFFKMNELQDLFTLGGDDGLASEEMSQEVEKLTMKLKNSASAQSDDLDKVVEIAGVSKLESFYNGKEQKEKAKNEDERLIDGLLGGSNNIEGISTHDQVVHSHMSSSKLVTKEAQRLAEEAVAALRKSRNSTKKFDIGTPTWTGKFGQAGKIKKRGKVTKKSLGSKEILNNIRAAKKEGANIDNTDTKSSSVIDSNEKILEKIENYLNSCPAYFASSKNIIEQLGIDLREKDSVVKVRALLKTISSFDKERKGWYLDEEFRN